MKLPNKIICYKESIISKLPIILNVLEDGSLSVIELFNNVKDCMDNVSDFIDALDCLYALGKIKFDNQTRGVSYVI